MLGTTKLRWTLTFAVAMATACDDPAADRQPIDAPNSNTGKADVIAGSCVEDEAPICGGISASGCGCDVECLDAGDCCADFAEACGLPIHAERGIELGSPISFDGFVSTLDDEIGTLRAGLEESEPAALLESLRQAALAQGAALMVSGIASPPADRFTGERTTFAELAHYQPGFDAVPVGTLMIETGPAVATATVIQDPEVPATLRLVSPISANVVVPSLLDQRHALAAALDVAEARAQIEVLDAQTQGRGEAMMVASFGSPVPGSTCRARQCRDTFVELVAWAPGETIRPLGILWVRNFAESRDWVLFEPAAD